MVSRLHDVKKKGIRVLLYTGVGGGDANRAVALSTAELGFFYSRFCAALAALLLPVQYGLN